jgi:tRNA threonylcarbamoyladenosine biosynthesis protein TsaB
MILAIETATKACSTALCAADGSVVAEALALDGPAHTQRLLPGVHEVLRAAPAGWADVDTVAVGLGPGAYTGLRIGVATARALAQADGRVRLAGVSTPEALALALSDGQPAGRRLVPLIDGKRREVFAAVYTPAAGGNGVRLVEPVTVVPADDLAVWLRRLERPLVGGDGAVVFAAALPAGVDVSATITAPTAAMVGRAVAGGSPGVVTGPDGVLPLYGRAPDAARWTGPAAAATATRP